MKQARNMCSAHAHLNRMVGPEMQVKKLGWGNHLNGFVDDAKPKACGYQTEVLLLEGPFQRKNIGRS